MLLGMLVLLADSDVIIGCLKRYHYHFYVNDNICYYYEPDTSSLPNSIQVAPHFFVERDLCEHFATQMNMAW